MASSNSITNRLGELRSPNPQSPPSESYSTFKSSNRYSGSFNPLSPPSDIRSSLQRRATQDSMTSALFPSILAQSQALDADPAASVSVRQDTLINANATATQTLFKPVSTDRKRYEIEMMRASRQALDNEIERASREVIEEEQKRLSRRSFTQDDMKSTMAEFERAKPITGLQSEPTTPPEYRNGDMDFPSIYSRRNRYSTSSMVSPPGFGNNRSSRSGSQLTSPPSEPAQNGHQQSNGAGSDKLPSKSVPGSRRGSNDRLPVQNLETPIMVPVAQSNLRSNRYSMPVTSKKAHNDLSSVLDLGHINTTGFLFGDDDEKSLAKESVNSSGTKNHVQLNTTDDKFPILVRNNQGGLLSASSAALDLALSQSPGPESQSNSWKPFARHRPAQQSLPQNIFDMPSPTAVTPASLETASEYPNSRTNRQSMEASVTSASQQGILSPTFTNGMRPNLSNIQSSYSTNDLPTLKNIKPVGAILSPQKTHAEQHLQTHNANMGRFPPNATSNRTSLTLSDQRRDETIAGLHRSPPSSLQANAVPFGPSTIQTHGVPAASQNMMPAGMQYGGNNQFAGYNNAMHFATMGMSNLNMGPPVIAYQPGGPGYNPAMGYGASMNGNGDGMSQYGQYGRSGVDSQARIMQMRREQNAADSQRFTNTKIESCQGDIYSLCKDQHGCRYLQKQLESQDVTAHRLIFNETNQHVVDLMTDPFGNYLCQKLLEYSSEEERTILINNAAPQMIKIALNQHGTRALQKMIEYVSTREQISVLIEALRHQVVELIQDLNGNHVIQKCLNRLSPEDAQFIFDAVGANCVVVGTHRHGCCVLQRCIDHASGAQKAHLISQITQNAFALVQDPFGNYVVQYIIDLQEPLFTNPLCYSFQTSIPALSRQKFSSNVIEKCIRGADPAIATMMVDEVISSGELERMLRDPYANYVIQTSLEHAEPDTKNKLVDAIRPLLPGLRGAPHARRIASRIAAIDGTELSGGATPTSNGGTPSRSGSMGGALVMASINGQNGVIPPNSAFFSQGPVPGPTYSPPTLPALMNYPPRYGGNRPPGRASGHGSQLSNGSSNYGAFSPTRGGYGSPNVAQWGQQGYGRGNLQYGANPQYDPAQQQDRNYF